MRDLILSLKPPYSVLLRPKTPIADKKITTNTTPGDVLITYANVSDLNDAAGVKPSTPIENRHWQIY